MEHVDPWIGARSRRRNTYRPSLRAIPLATARLGQESVELVYNPAAPNRRAAVLAMRIRLTYAKPQYGIKPYYCEMDTEAYDGRPHGELLRLHLDRSVEIEWITPQPQRLGVDGATTRFGLATGNPLEGLYHVVVRVVRYQLAAAVPQSPLDPTGAPGDPDVLTVDLQHTVRLVIQRSVTPEGGAKVIGWAAPINYVRSAERGTAVSQHSASPLTGSPNVLFELALDIWNADHRAAWSVQSRSRGNRAEIVVCFDRNVRPRMRVAGVDPVPFALRAMARSWPLDLRLARLDHMQVPRPLDRLRTQGEPWVSASVLRGQITRLPPTPVEELADRLALTAIGFLPVIGDLYDLTEFAYAVTTDHDLSGESTDAHDKLILALCLLPAVPGALRHLTRAVERVRPGVRALEATQAVVRTRLADSTVRWGLALKRLAGVQTGETIYAALRQQVGHEQLFAMGSVRSEQLTRLLLDGRQ